MRAVRFLARAFHNGQLYEPGDEILVSETTVLSAHMLDLATQQPGGQGLPPINLAFRADLAHDLSAARLAHGQTPERLAHDDPAGRLAHVQRQDFAAGAAGFAADIAHAHAPAASAAATTDIATDFLAGHLGGTG